MKIAKLKSGSTAATTLSFRRCGRIDRERHSGFRSVDGLYNQQYKYPPETILSHTFF